MGCFLKKEVFEKADTFKKLSTIDPADKKNNNTQSMLTLNFCTLLASCFVYSSVKSEANHFSELFLPPETKCSGRKNAIPLVFGRAKETFC